MRIAGLIALLIATVAGNWPSPAEATTVNGMCLRNTGVPTGQLNLRDRCDVAEFWTRQNRSF